MLGKPAINNDGLQMGFLRDPGALKSACRRLRVRCHSRVSPRQGGSSRTASDLLVDPVNRPRADFHKMLTNQIMSVSTELELQEVLTTYGDDVNEINLSALFTVATRVVQPPPDQDPRRTVEPGIMSDLVSISRSHVPQFTAQTLTAILRAMAKSGHSDPQFLGELTACIPHRIDSMGPKSCAVVLWAVSKFHDSPPAANWFTCLLDGCHRQLPSCSSKDLAMMAYSLASMRCQPSWMKELLNTYKDLLHMSDPQGLANVMWALVKLEVKPETDFICQYLHTCLDKQVWLQSPSGAMTLGALARGGFSTPSDWLEAYLAGVEKVLDTYTLQELSTTIWALARWSHRPTTSWATTFFKACSARLSAGGYCSAVDLSNMIWSLAVLRLPPEQEFTHVFFTASQHLLASYPTAALSSTAWALTALQVRPPAPWWRAYLSQVFDQLLPADDIAFANVMFCAAMLDMAGLEQSLEAYVTDQGGNLSMERYAQLLRVVEGLAAMDNKMMRTAWMAFSDTDWSLSVAGSPPGGEPEVPPAPHGLVLRYQDLMPLRGSNWDPSRVVWLDEVKRCLQ